MKTLFQTYVEEFSDIHYCGHCLAQQNTNCCDYSHIVEFKDLTISKQQQIIQQELDENQRS